MVHPEILPVSFRYVIVGEIAIDPSIKMCRTSSMNEQTIISNAPDKNAVQWADEGNLLYESRHYEEALAAFERAIQLDPGNTIAQCGKASSLNCLGRYEQALTAYTCAILLDPNYAYAYSSMGMTLFALGRY